MVTGMARRKQWSLEYGVVRGLAQSAAALCLGSAAFHASHTRLGARADNDLIGVMSFILRQASISRLPDKYKTLTITDLGTYRSGFNITLKHNFEIGRAHV